MLLRIIFLSFVLSLIIGCARNSGEKKDNSDLYAQSMARDAIIKRSGTKLDPDSDMALADAENRLMTGGGLFGKRGIVFNDFISGGENSKVASVGLPINSILWKSSIEVINFMPISSTDPFSGTIITDWYSGPNNNNERCKINIFIKGKELKSNNLEVNSFCQSKTESDWVDIASDEDDDRKIENAILNKAKKIKLSAN